MNRFRISLCSVALALASVGTAQAAAIASGKIISGTTFGSNDAFQFFNNSTAGEKIVSLTWDLTAVNAFFDATNTSPGNSSSPLTLGASSSVGHTFPTNASVDGQSSLTITFTNFDPGEFFRFGVDTDFLSAIDGFGLTGDQFIGASATVLFDNGVSRTGRYVATTEAGFGSFVAIDQPVQQVPVPASLALIGLGLCAMGAVRRKVR